MVIMERYWGNKENCKQDNMAILSITEHFTVSYINLSFIVSNSDNKSCH